MKLDHTDSLLSGNVEYLDENETLLMIEADVTKNTTRKLKDDFVFLLNDVKSILHGKPIKIYGEPEL